MKQSFFKKYIKEKIRRVNDTAKLRYMSVKEATTLAKTEVDVRLAGMNEFREALKDNNNSFIYRNEYQIQIDKLNDDIQSLKETRANTEGKASMTSVYISYAIAIIALTISIIRIFI